MPNQNLKHNYILMTYDSDADESYYEKLYCTKTEAKKYMVRQMYEWIKGEYDVHETNDIVEWVALGEPHDRNKPVFTASIQFPNYHVTLELIHSIKIPKSEVYVENLNQFEQKLLEEGYLNEEDYDFDWEHGTVTEN